MDKEGTPQKTNEITSVLYVMCAGALWGFVGIFFSMLSSLGLSGMQVVAVRVTSASIFILPVLFVKGLHHLRIRYSDVWCFAGTGLVSFVFFCWCYFMAIDETSLAVAVILMYTSPVFVMLFAAVFFHERVTLQKIFALLVTLVGCVLVSGVGRGDAISLIGFAYGMGAAIGYSLYSIFGRVALDRGYGPLTISAYTFFFAALGSLPLSGLWNEFDTLTSPHALAGAIGIGVLCCILPFLLYTKGLAGMDTGKAAILATVEPAVAALLSFFVHGESLINLKGCGMILILASIVILNYQGRQKDDRAG